MLSLPLSLSICYLSSLLFLSLSLHPLCSSSLFRLFFTLPPLLHSSPPLLHSSPPHHVFILYLFFTLCPVFTLFFQLGTEHCIPVCRVQTMTNSFLFEANKSYDNKGCHLLTPGDFLNVTLT